MNKLSIIARGAILMFAMTAACFGILGLLSGCAAPSAAVQITSAPSTQGAGPATVGAAVAPLAALNITRCDGALVLYILIDSDHMLRFDQERTTILVRGPNGISEQSGPSTPWKNALELAQTAGITANTDVKCDGGVGT